jgi:hypothetical protein
VNVVASREVLITGIHPEGFASTVTSQAIPGSTGAAGSVVVSAPVVRVTAEGEISSTTFGMGHGGEVTVSASELLLVSGRGALIRSDSTGPGDGGTIRVRAGTVELGERGAISARSSGSGVAGDIDIQAGTVRMRQGAITTEASRADGGNITLDVETLVHLVDSGITATVQGGEGKGGNVSLDSRLVVLDGSQIRADAFGGPGGNVRMIADVFLTTGSAVSASSALGLPGTVDINAQVTDVSGDLARLPEAVLAGATLLRQACAVRFAEGRASSLALGVRDAPPAEPEGIVASPLLLDLQATEGEPAPAGLALAVRSVPVLVRLHCPR